jgi:hypothetical protein
MERAEAELFIRLRRQLGTRRIGEWLDSQGGREHILSARDLVTNESSFIHFIYSVLYADSRLTFGYGIEDTNDQKDSRNTAGASVRTGGYVVPDVLLRRKG